MGTLWSYCLCDYYALAPSHMHQVCSSAMQEGCLHPFGVGCWAWRDLELGPYWPPQHTEGGTREKPATGNTVYLHTPQHRIQYMDIKTINTNCMCEGKDIQRTRKVRHLMWDIIEKMAEKNWQRKDRETAKRSNVTGKGHCTLFWPLPNFCSQSLIFAMEYSRVKMIITVMAATDISFFLSFNTVWAYSSAQVTL